jgi:hypothetical protein
MGSVALFILCVSVHKNKYLGEGLEGNRWGCGVCVVWDEGRHEGGGAGRRIAGQNL